MALERCDEDFEKVFKKFDEIQFNRKVIDDLNLNTIPTGSQEFQKVLWACDDSAHTKDNKENDDSQFRQRSQTIDSTYAKRKKHHVHFSSHLETAPTKLGSSESIDGTIHGILMKQTGRERSNTIDTVYKKEKKFITIPQTSSHHSSSDSIEGATETAENQAPNGSKHVQYSKRRTGESAGNRSSPVDVKGIKSPERCRKSNGQKVKGGVFTTASRKISGGGSPLARSHNGSPQQKHSRGDHHVTSAH